VAGTGVAIAATVRAAAIGIDAIAKADVGLLFSATIDCDSSGRYSVGGRSSSQDTPQDIPCPRRRARSRLRDASSDRDWPADVAPRPLGIGISQAWTKRPQRRPAGHGLVYRFSHSRPGETMAFSAISRQNPVPARAFARIAESNYNLIALTRFAACRRFILHVTGYDCHRPSRRISHAHLCRGMDFGRPGVGSGRGEGQ